MSIDLGLLPRWQKQGREREESKGQCHKEDEKKRGSVMGRGQGL